MNQSIFEIQAEFCKAMGNAARLQILHLLREHPMTVGEISKEMNLPQSSVSRHLKALRTVGVLTSKRHGIEIVYQISDRKIMEICDMVRTVLIEQIQKRSRSIE
jgi:DNA-binding transcriptional ArsR family regulator